MVDILSHHFYPSLRWRRHALVSRAVCRSWRDAFFLLNLDLPKEALENNLNLCKNIVLKTENIRLRKPSQVDLDVFCDLAPSCTLLSSVTIELMEANRDYLATLSKFLRLDLPRLRNFALSSELRHTLDASKEIAEALCSTNLHLKTLNLSRSKLGDEGGARLFLGLTSNQTLRTLIADSNSLGSKSLRSLTTLLSENQTLTKLKVAYNYQLFLDPDSCRAFIAALATNSTLKRLDFGSCSSDHAYSVLSALQTNIGLSSVKASYINMSGEHLPFVFGCLEGNTTLESFEVTFSSRFDEGPAALGQFFERNQTLKRLHVQMSGSEQMEFGLMFEGLRKNTSITSLSFGSVSAAFVQQLGDCILASPTLPLQRLEIDGSILQGSLPHLLMALSSCNTLQELRLNTVLTDVSSAASCAHLIDVTTSIKCMQLFGSDFGEEGTSNFLAALARNSSLRDLRVAGLHGSDKNGEELCEAIERNRFLVDLDILDSPFPIRMKPRFKAALMTNSTLMNFAVEFLSEVSDGSRDYEVPVWSGNLCLE
jgi:hypothetical protein